jgi:gliding motility-associated-like protein
MDLGKHKIASLSIVGFLIVAQWFPLGGLSMVYSAPATFSPLFNLASPPPDTICKGDTIGLSATNPLALSYIWTPAYHISSTSIANPLVYPDTTTMYHVTINGITSNLIINGNFTMGNVGFTSAYTYTTNLWPEATYCIGPNPNTFHSGFAACGDHTTGTGNMMVVNAAGTPNTTIWQQTVPVVPFSNYVFSCWLASVHSSSPAQLQFFVNNIQIGPVFQATATTCNWNMFYNLWNSGTATSAVISIKNQNTSLSGNDFAIDDIYFAQVVQIHDSTLIVVENPNISLGPDTAICHHDSISLSPGPGFAQYQWSNGSITPSTVVSSAGNHWVAVKTAKGCPASDTMHLTQHPSPQIIVTGDTACFGDTAYLAAQAGAGDHYLWNTGAITSGIAVSPSSTTTYAVLVTDTNGCRDSAMTQAVINPLPVIHISSDTTICRGTSATLSATGGLHFVWNPNGLLTPSITVTPLDPVTKYQVLVTDLNGCSDSASVEVSTIPYPNITLSKEADTLCKGVTTSFTASGGDTYLWSTGDMMPVISVSPITSSNYTITVTNSSGTTHCAKDTFLFQAVENCNVIYIPNAISLTGTNRIFKPVGEFLYADEYRFTIYNRWGQRLFETSDFNQGWDGTYQNSPVPEGVYVYDILIVSGFDEPFRRRGTITVVR